jgi:hypothetical protein
MGSPNPSQASLTERMASVGKALGEREAQQAEALAEARVHAERWHQVVIDAIASFEGAAAAAGAPHLAIEMSEPGLDDKHVRSVEFDLQRGCHRAIVTFKSRGEVTLVGPFQAGKVEGPCQRFPFDAGAEIEAALGDFLERFLEEAATP